MSGLCDRLKLRLGDRKAIFNVAPLDTAASAVAATHLASRKLDNAADRHSLIAQLVTHVEVDHNEIRTTLGNEAVRELLGSDKLRTKAPLELAAPATRIRQGKKVRMIVADQDARSADTINKPLVALLAEAKSTWL